MGVDGLIGLLALVILVALQQCRKIYILNEAFLVCLLIRTDGKE